MRVQKLNPSEMLEDCCLLKTPVRIIIPPLIIEGRFAAASKLDVVFDLIVDLELGLLQPLSACCVVFNHGDKASVFLASLKDYNGQQPTLQLRLQRVSDVASGDRRMAWRVPVDDKCGLRAEVRTQDDNAWVVRVVDISGTGMMIEFPKGSAPHFEVGALLDVELRLDNHIARLAGLARRRSGRRWGVFFPDVLKQGRVQPLQSLRLIVDRLERNPMPPNLVKSS